MGKLILESLTYEVIGAAMEVHRELGPGFSEHVYQAALARELQLRRVVFAEQVRYEVPYKGIVVGRYRADMLVSDALLVELKAISGLVTAHVAQVMHYLAASGLELGLLLNFGEASLRVRRVILTNRGLKPHNP